MRGARSAAARSPRRSSATKCSRARKTARNLRATRRSASTARSRSTGRIIARDTGRSGSRDRSRGGTGRQLDDGDCGAGNDGDCRGRFDFEFVDGELVSRSGGEAVNLPKRINTKLGPREALAAFFRAGFKSTGTPRERRIYKTLWARVKGLDPEVRRLNASQRRAYCSTPKGKNAALQACLRWRRKNRKRCAEYTARYHREHRRRHCYFCG